MVHVLSVTMIQIGGGTEDRPEVLVVWEGVCCVPPRLGYIYLYEYLYIYTKAWSHQPAHGAVWSHPTSVQHLHWGDCQPTTLAQTTGCRNSSEELSRRARKAAENMQLTVMAVSMVSLSSAMPVRFQACVPCLFFKGLVLEQTHVRAQHRVVVWIWRFCWRYAYPTGHRCRWTGRRSSVVKDDSWPSHQSASKDPDQVCV